MSFHSLSHCLTLSNLNSLNLGTKFAGVGWEMGVARSWAWRFFCFCIKANLDWKAMQHVGLGGGGGGGGGDGI